MKGQHHTVSETISGLTADGKLGGFDAFFDELVERFQAICANIQAEDEASKSLHQVMQGLVIVTKQPERRTLATR